MKKITFTVPVGGKIRAGISMEELAKEVADREDRQGYVAWLRMGPTRHKFVLQLKDDKAHCLADYRTGMLIADLGEQLLYRYVQNPYNDQGMAAYRQVAQNLVSGLVERYGVDEIYRRMALFPTLNEG